MKFKGIFFDLYGTLLIYNNNSKAWADWISTFYDCLQDYGLKQSKELFAIKCDGFFGRDEPPGLNDGLTIYERRIQRLCKELSLELNNKELNFTANSCLNAWIKYTSLDPMTIPLLKEFKKNKKIALISNFDYPPHIYSVLSEMNIHEYFDSVVISGEVGVKKPDPTIFSFALEQTGLRNDEVVYIGDAPEDIQGARAAGIHPILIQRKLFDSDSQITDYWANQESNNNHQDNSIFSKVKRITHLKELLDLIS
ncbi:MAG: HAD family hydrolase [Candidatus Lokiarchaeota archaeon]|nr:HAD family hydrolase [Candidatus Lokiarchaeota archaeon]